MRWRRSASASRDSRSPSTCAMGAHPNAADIFLQPFPSGHGRAATLPVCYVPRPMAAITPQIVAAHGLSQDEYARIHKALARDPNLVELGIFSAMWSEHCSYKSSRRFLRHLPTKGARVLQGPGENAGVIDVGGGLRSEEHTSELQSPYDLV